MKLSQEEIDSLYLPERKSALKVAEKINLPLKSNVRESIDLELTPYLKKPVELIGKNKYETLGVIAPTQSGKTVFLQIVIADSIDQDPGTTFYVMPDEKTARRSFQEKVIDVVNNNKDLSDKLIENNRSSVTLSNMKFNDMTIYPAWAGSLGQLSSIPAKRGVLDEVRLMKLYTGEESNAIQLLEDRLTTYKSMGLAQMYLVSTPSIEGDLLHQQLDVYGTTVLHWHVPCPQCGKYQRLNFFKHMKPNEGKCLCLYCKGEFKDDNFKKDWNQYGVYAPLNKINADGSLKPVKYGSRLFFRYNSLVSPFRTFYSIWDKYLKTKDKRQDYKNFIQAWLAEFWVEDVSKMSSTTLKNNIKDYQKTTVLPDTKIITAGIDTQDNGFYVVVRGFFNGRQSYVLDEFFIESKIMRDTADDIAKKFLNLIFNRIYADENGNKWKIAVTAIDSGGHRTKILYEVKEYIPKLILVKGRDSQNVTIKFNNDLDLYLVRTIEYLDETELLSNSKENFWFPKNISEDFLNQYTNVRKFKKENKETGESVVKYKRVGQYDYRMADIHTFICLDVPYEEGNLRANLEDDNFKLNPMNTKIKEEYYKESGSSELEEETYDDFYEFEDWWS